MRATWKGALSFGLVTIPVKLFGATQEKGIRFHLLHRVDGGRIRHQRVCALDGQEVGWEDVVRGYEYEEGRYVTVTDEELDALPVPTVRTIDVQRFVSPEEIDPIYLQQSYYVVPEPAGARGYALLREAMREGPAGTVALAKVVIHEREHPAVLRVRDGVLVLTTMYWPDEVRPAAFTELEQPAEVRPEELAMARVLVQSLRGAFQPEELRDEYRAAVEELITRKVKGEEAAVPREAGKQEQVGDLLEALQQSVERLHGARGPGGRAKG